MNCEACGRELPVGAMFCGECGRAVGARIETVDHVDSGMPIESDARTGAGDTAVIEQEALPLIEPTPQPEPEIEQDLPPEESGQAAPGVTGPPVRQPIVIPPVARMYPDPFPWGGPPVAAASLDSDDLEGTIIVPRREQGERFVLQFSTGESVTVFGSGLLGRHPIPQPGEYFDQLVTISDPGKSVSKTHLEFGQEAGSFWVGDRFSGNGSVVREPESAPHRLTAGKRYRIVRGTRVDIGEQFFIVS